MGAPRNVCVFVYVYRPPYLPVGYRRDAVSNVFTSCLAYLMEGLTVTVGSTEYIYDCLSCGCAVLITSTDEARAPTLCLECFTVCWTTNLDKERTLVLRQATVGFRTSDLPVRHDWLESPPQMVLRSHKK